MTGRRVCAMLAVILSTTACATVGAGGAAPANTASRTVQLGPLPTQPTTSTVVAPSQTDAVTTTAPVSVPSATAAPTTTSATVATRATTTSTSIARRIETIKTSCIKVAYIGDSVSLGMMSPETLPDASTRLDFRLATIGVVDLRSEISGGRSMVETLPGQENAVAVATRLRDTGFAGCWVIAIGTNDAANIAAGGAKHAEERIAALMSVIGTDPVLWIDAATIADSGYWASPNMVGWNATLTATAAAYPNVRIAPWSTFVGSQWFTSDGIHLNSAGAAARVQFVANALIANFPQKGR
ncbi:MAG: hypothetical protein ACXVH5_02115 [Ilumatobacteraceae bacterium]